MLNAGKDYPLGKKRPDLIRTATGRTLDEITVENMDALSAADFKISKEALLYQAEIAESIGNWHIGNNLRRSAELIDIPEEELLLMYNAMRPYRSTKEELLAIAGTLRNTYGASLTASFYEESASMLERMKRLKNDR